MDQIHGVKRGCSGIFRSTLYLIIFSAQQSYYGILFSSLLLTNCQWELARGTRLPVSGIQHPAKPDNTGTDKFYNPQKDLTAVKNPPVSFLPHPANNFEWKMEWTHVSCINFWHFPQTMLNNCDKRFAQTVYQKKSNYLIVCIPYFNFQAKRIHLRNLHIVDEIVNCFLIL